MIRPFLLALTGASALATPALAQDHDHSAMGHGAMQHGTHTDTGPHDKLPRDCGGSLTNFTDGSGTSRLPGGESGQADACHSPVAGHAPGGLHLTAGDWMVMAHGFVSAQYTDHSGPHGDDKAYATSMAMLTAGRETGWGRVQFKSMFSLEPAMDPRGYPNLFATGETARGMALVDRQHPHDLFMELAVRLDFDLGRNTSLFVYGGPVGEPALGPSAFMHRGSARYNPEPPITHHWFDSTHITYGVATVGISSERWQVEASAFRGAEPDEDRWDIETPRFDSWSVRASFTPVPQWTLQASYGELDEPEALHPGQDERRFTASAHYASRGLSAMLAFSAKDRVPGNTLTAWLGEANWNLSASDTIFGRIENVANDELFPDHNDPLHDRSFRITKVQAGYARRIALHPFELALGGSLAAFAKPAALNEAYGRDPWGYTIFARLSLGH